MNKNKILHELRNELLNELKLISNVTRDEKSYTIRHEVDETSMMLTAKIVEVEPDEFFDDPFDLELSLITRMKEACEASGNVEDVPQSRTIPEGRSKFEHYSALTNSMYHLADVRILNNTKKFRAEYLIMSSDLLPVFVFSPDFKQEPVIKLNGMYVAGSYKNIPVLVSPVLNKGEMIWGVNEDKSSSVLTFLNNNDQVCSKVVNPKTLFMMKLHD
jgi:hypothetical protein